MREQNERGQVLPLTAIFMGALLLFAALAIDVTSVLASERFYTTTADAAALAGAQDLQRNKTRQVTLNERSRARENALRVVLDELDVPQSACSTSSDLIDCELTSASGTRFLVSIQTPAPWCAQCDVDRAVKVTIRNPAYPLTFARLAGQTEWNVESSAVAGLVFQGKYALIAMKPQDDYDPGIVVNGTGTVVRVQSGDVGTNTHLVENSGDVRFGESGYYIRHLNDTMKNGKLGFTPASLSKSLGGDYIRDPLYDGPQWPTDKYDGQTDPAATEECPTEVTSLARITDLVDAGVIADVDEVTCYKPGVYAPGKGNLKQFAVQNGDVVYLLPGAYLFEGGFDVNNGGYIYGGLVASDRAVLLSVPSDKEMDLEGATELVLNTAVSGPAQDYLENDIDTGDADPNTKLVITFYVPRDPACFEGGGDVPLDSRSCSANPVSAATIKLAGTGALEIGGVIYAPTENISIVGGSTSSAIDGQIIGWTLDWSGGSTLDINYPNFEQQGIMRLDAACTGTERCS